MAMYRGLGLSAIEATATCSFTVLVTALMNCIQAIFYGSLEISEFLFYFSICTFGSFVISVVVSARLQQMHRLSYIELLLLIMIVLGLINMPFGLWFRYAESGYEPSVLFGFGSFC